ncbi:HyaD/HybD family hydrogenase maturation endopeptidase [Actinomadura sp. ATCC 31491]|uniref:HyaD/HybD family hydrogenase maturation endopeptidase n=1 Tax=Actinomadura luzonensis TaxID=2805427 RepID=A0ABT0FX69_9ACTN|nr:HyaD/HybD family hydrogenase maturation endopeptidase [Actinomadura luzonensis]MCK2216951.1 HyaD/HybD family hydrogenase maturation endopeptidase [Actinomadura luzonensis]
MREPVLVLGVGNELFTDEGVGVAAARRLAGLRLPGVEVVDGGTLGVGLLPAIAGREALLITDAIVRGDARPGTVIVLRGEEIPDAGPLMVSAHQTGVGQALAAADLAGCRPPRLAAVGMVPASLETGYGLSPLAAGRLGRLVAGALDVLAGWGVHA